MQPDSPSAPGKPAPAACPVHKPARPYGVYPAPPNLVRAAGTPMDAAAATPRETAPSKPAEAPGAASAPAAAPAAPAATPPPSPPASAAGAATAGPRPARPLRRRHERFCIAYVLGGNATRAAWDAGYSSANGANQGYRLLRRPEIQARLAELQRGLARGFAGDAEALLGKLEAVYRQAVEGKYFNAAVRIVEVQARMAGHLKSRAKLPAELENDEK